MMIRSFSPNKNANIYAETSIKDTVEFANRKVLSVLSANSPFLSMEALYLCPI